MVTIRKTKINKLMQENKRLTTEVIFDQFLEQRIGKVLTKDLPKIGAKKIERIEVLLQKEIYWIEIRKHVDHSILSIFKPAKPHAVLLLMLGAYRCKNEDEVESREQLHPNFSKHLGDDPELSKSFTIAFDEVNKYLPEGSKLDFPLYAVHEGKVA